MADKTTDHPAPFFCNSREKKMKPASNNISCTALTDALTTLAHNTSPDRPQTIEAVSRKHTCRLADTAEAVREVARKMSKYF